MESTLLGVVIGSSVTFLGTFVSHAFTLAKEIRLWKLQQKSESEKRNREDRKKQEKNIKDAYYNCINNLSLLVASKSENTEDIELDKEKFIKAYEDSLKYLTILSLHNRDRLLEEDNSKFLDDLKYYRNSFEKYTAQRLLKEVNNLAINDNLLFDIPIKSNEQNKSKDIYKFKCFVSQNLRKKCFIKGVILNSSYSFQLELSSISNSQRKLLWELHFQPPSSTLPNDIGHLKLPSIGNKKDISPQGANWEIDFNPIELDEKIILQKWENDCKKILKKLESEINNLS